MTAPARAAALAAAVVLNCAAGPAGAAEDPLPGPVAAHLVTVIDGDTLRVTARVWLRMTLSVDVRIRGIDAPEVRGKCPNEKAMATMATDFLRRSVAAEPLSLVNVGEDKYYGRVVADVIAGGSDVGALMLASGLARPYDGGSRGEWCGLAESGGS